MAAEHGQRSQQQGGEEKECVFHGFFSLSVSSSVKRVLTTECFSLPSRYFK